MKEKQLTDEIIKLMQDAELLYDQMYEILKLARKKLNELYINDKL